MPLPVEWRPEALSDLLQIVDYIADENISAAINLSNEIKTKVGKLGENPYMFKRSPRLNGLREMVVHPNYIVFYRVTYQSVEIINIVHAKRQWP